MWLSSLQGRLGPIARWLVWLQMLPPMMLLCGAVLPEGALLWLAEREFLFNIPLVYSLYCAAPLVSLLAMASTMTLDAW